MRINAENVLTANGQIISQTILELNVFRDNLLDVTALADSQLMDTHARLVSIMKDKTHKMKGDAFQLQNALDQIKSKVSATSKAAMLVELALRHWFHQRTENRATDQPRNVHAVRNNLLMVIAALTAQMDKFQTIIDNNATQRLNALEKGKSSDS